MLHRRDIEGLRALAVAAVILFHFGVPGTRGGFVGVDVFFVISGFLITSLLVAERENTGSISLGAFYARRARRILPISALVLCVTAFASAVWLEPTRLENLATDIAGAAFFGANLVFGGRGADYLTSNLPPSPVLHYWSLAVEEQFYMVWPALLAALSWRARSARPRIVAGVTAVVAASLALSVVWTQRQPSWSYYGLHTRAWELALGALLAVSIPAVLRVPLPVRAVGGWAGLAGIVACTVTFGTVSTFPGWVAILPVASTLLVIAAGDTTVHGPARLLSNRVLQWAGTRSYSLYLWHWPALVIAESRVDGTLPPATRVALLVGVVVVAELGYRFIEQPVRHSRRLVADVGLSLLLGAFLVAAGTLASVLLWRHQPDLATGATIPPPTIAVTSTLAGTTSTTTPEAEPPPVSNGDATTLPAVAESASNRILPDNLQPSLSAAAADTGRHYQNDCFRFSDPAVNEACTLGDRNGDIVVALWGDSHAAQWASALENIAVERGWRMHLMTRGGCGYLGIVTYNFVDKRPSEQCVAWREQAEKKLTADGVDVVFVSQYLGYSAASDRRLVPVGTWLESHRALVDRLAAAGIEVVLLGDTPNPSKDVPSCLSSHRRDILACAPLPTKPRERQLIEGFAALAARQGSGYLDIHRWLCTPTVCPPVVGNLLVYRDNNHVSNTFMKWLEPVLSEAISARVEWVGRMHG